MKYILLLLCLIGINSFAQKNYHPGYVVTNTNDTVKGYINVRHWDLNPKSIQFKQNDSDEIKEYQADEILSFEVPGYCMYLKYSGAISDEINIDTPDTIGRKFKETNILLKSLVEAPYISLYVYKDRLKERFFIKDKQNRVSELLSYNYLTNNKKETYEPYKKNLRTLLNDYGLMNEKSSQLIRTTAYSGPHMKKMIRTANLLESKQTKEKLGFLQPFIGITGNIAVMAFEGNHLLGREETSTTTYIKPGFQSGLLIYANPKIRKTALQISLNVNKVKSSIEGEEKLDHGRVRYGKYNFESWIISPFLGIKYNFYNNPFLKFYGGFGVSFNFPINPVSEYSYKMSESFIQLELEAPPRMEEYKPELWLGVPIEAGFVLFKKVHVFGIYEQPFGKRIFSSSQYGILSKTYSAGIRYAF